MDNPEIMTWDQAVYWIAFGEVYGSRNKGSLTIWAAAEPVLTYPQASPERRKQLTTAKINRLQKAAAHLLLAVNNGEVRALGRKKQEQALELLPAEHQVDISLPEFPRPSSGAGWQDLHFKRDDVLKNWPQNPNMIEKIAVKLLSKRGRKKEDGAIDDTKALARMENLIDTGMAKSPHEAAKIVANDINDPPRGASPASTVRRLQKKFSGRKSDLN